MRFEFLELRQVLSASTVATDQLVTPNLLVLPDASSGVSGLTPAQVRAAYGFNSITFGSVVGSGANQTIAIVDAYNDPNIISDLATFDRQFGIAAPPSFKVVNETGGSSLPQSDRGWSSEIALDVEWAHAIAPGANILLVEASSAYTSDLDRALDFARNATGVVVVSNSWGGSEYSTESSEDVHFTTPSGHAGVTFTVAAGDSGTGAEYPSSSPDVLSVGGSTLRLTSSGSYSSESVWSGGGGGASRYEGRPSFQNGSTTGNRGTPDVSYDANPSTGFAVYDSYGSGGWAQFGGTSAGAPQWAALIAIADQGRALAGKGSLANAQDAIYSLSSADFHDITSGSDGLSATTGYDVASGRGSPIASSVIRDLVSYSSSTSFTVASTTSTTRNTSGFWWWGWGGFFFDAPAGGGAAAVAAAASSGAGDSSADLGAVAANGNAAASSTYTDALPVQLAQLNDAALQTLASDGNSSAAHCNDVADVTDNTAAHAALDSFFAQLENNATAHGLLSVA
ncbi:MAG TPA: S53 family peptidase [Pirellulales bacterium]